MAILHTYPKSAWFGRTQALTLYKSELKILLCCILASDFEKSNFSRTVCKNF